MGDAVKLSERFVRAEVFAQALEELEEYLIANPSRECLVCGKEHWNSLCDECDQLGRAHRALLQEREEGQDANS